MKNTGYLSSCELVNADSLAYIKTLSDNSVDLIANRSVTPQQDAQQAVVVSHPAVSDIIPASDAAVTTVSTGVTSSVDSSGVVSWGDLAKARESLNVAIDREMERVTDDQLYQALVAVRTDVNRDISARLEQIDRMTERTPVQVMPALVLAADWYDSAARAGDITARNGIRHPGFVPVQPLKVPVR